VKKYYVCSSFDDVDLAPTWEVRKKSFLFFSCFVCEFDHKHKARKLAAHLNKKERERG
jgi:hypothetical protein